MGGTGTAIRADGLIRRQKLMTWGILGLALFVSVGMAEWAKRTAVGETVIDPAVMEEAVKIAAAAIVNVKVNVNEKLGGELPATSNPKPATSRSESAAKIQATLGVEK